jgi:hypothetical protein
MVKFVQWRDILAGETELIASKPLLNDDFKAVNVTTASINTSIERIVPMSPPVKVVHHQ